MNTDQIEKARQLAEQQAWHAFRGQMEAVMHRAFKASHQGEPEASAEWRASIAQLFQELGQQLQAIEAAAAAAATWPQQAPR